MRLDLGVARTPARMLFGTGQIRALGRVAADLGHRALICTDGRLGALPLMDELVADLRQHGLVVEVFAGTEAELPLAGIQACVERYAGFDPDVLIGLGGGSCLDMAKLVSLLLTHGGPVSRYYGEFKVPGPVRPLILIPTTAGTGSEVTPVAVLADPEREMKVGVSAPELIPHTSICDPALTLSCPPQLTALSGADALAHAIEAYAATRRPAEADIAMKRVFVGKNAFSDQYARSAIQLIFNWLPRAVAAADDLDARSAMMLASTFAGLAFSAAGTSAAHAIQYPIGALTHTAHGLGIAVLLPHAMAFNAPAAGAAYGEIADLIGASPTMTDRAQAAIEAVRTLFAGIGIPPGLKQIGLSEADIGWVAERSVLATRLVENNPRTLDVRAVTEILEQALAGARFETAEHRRAAH